MTIASDIRGAVHHYTVEHYNEPKFLILSEKLYHDLFIWCTEIKRGGTESYDIVKYQQFRGLSISVIKGTHEESILKVAL